MARIHRRSEEIFARARTLIPGGVNSPARAFGAVGGTPVVIDRADGAYLYDVDGNRYIDYVLSWGPMILGHAHPAVTEALERAVRRGTSYGAPTESENQIAELIIELVPSIEKVRLVNSGTEATMSAIRLARGFTGRSNIVKFIGCYHGHSDALLVSAGSAAATLGVPNSPGVTAGAAADTISLQYNDPNSFNALFDRMGGKIAGVIIEPVVGNMGCVPAQDGFLELIRRRCTESGAILIFDEVMTGFRVGLGGAQERFGITPDLTTLGKIIGGGLPVGAYGGRRDIMDAVLPTGKVFQAGTLSGNPLATAAGIAALTVLRDDPDFYERLFILTERLVRGLQAGADEANVRAVCQRVGAMATLFFLSDEDEAVSDWPSASRCDVKRFARFFHSMLSRGIYLPCSQYEAMFTSGAHTEEMIDETLEQARAAFIDCTAQQTL